MLATIASRWGSVYFLLPVVRFGTRETTSGRVFEAMAVFIPGVLQDTKPPCGSPRGHHRCPRVREAGIILILKNACVQKGLTSVLVKILLDSHSASPSSRLWKSLTRFNLDSNGFSCDLLGNELYFLHVRLNRIYGSLSFSRITPWKLIRSCQWSTKL